GQPLAPSSHNGLDGLVEIRHCTRRATHGRACPGIGLRDGLANAFPGSCYNGNFPAERLVSSLHTLPPIAYDNATNPMHDKRRTSGRVGTVGPEGMACPPLRTVLAPFSAHGSPSLVLFERLYLSTDRIRRSSFPASNPRTV